MQTASDMNEVRKKYERLKEILESLGSVCVAFSGGVDSSFLLAAAGEVLGDRAVAVTVSAEMIPERELKNAADFAADRGVRHVVLPVSALEVEGFSQNPPDRCYICKKAVFGRILEEAEKLGAAKVVDGTNLDDTCDYRPGMRALEEMEILSPLKEAGFTKADIRAMSREMGLPTHDMPSYACLASRIPYGDLITEARLKLVERGEEVLHGLGFEKSRLRLVIREDRVVQGRENEVLPGSYTARIEVEPERFGDIMNEEVREHIVRSLKELGFSYVALDLEGYRTGSLNETLKK